MRYTQAPNNEARTTIVIRTAVDPIAVTAALRDVVSAIDEGVPVDRVETMEQTCFRSGGGASTTLG